MQMNYIQIRSAILAGIHGLCASFSMLVICAGCFQNTIQEAEEYPSPDGKYVATFFLINYGATVSDCPQVYLRRNGESLGKKGNVFRGHKTFRLKVEWTSQTNLNIYHSPDCRVDFQVKQLKDVKVTVIQSEGWMKEDRIKYLQKKGGLTNNPANPKQ